MGNRWGNNGNSDRLYFGGSEITAYGDCNHEIKRCLLLWRKAMANLDGILKSRDITFPTKISLVKVMVFHSHVQMWEMDSKESWTPENWCFWTVMWERLLNVLDCKEIQPVHSKCNQSWICIGRTNPDAEAPVLWPPHMNNWLIGKDPDALKDWR